MDYSHKLPADAVELGLQLKFPSSCFSSITRGYESQGQDDKWSIYWNSPWIQIWRPSKTGLFSYAVRFEQIESQRIQVVESWVGREILSAFSRFTPDLEQHRGIVTFILEELAGFPCERFQSRVVNGTRRRKHVEYSGTVATLSDLDEVVTTLREQVKKMLSDNW